MSKPGKSLKNNQRIILSKLENTFCGDMERLCSKSILDGYNSRLRASGIRINIYEFYIKKGDGYKLKKNYRQILNQKFNKKNLQLSMENAKEIRKKSIEIENENKKKVELLRKELQQRIRASLKKDQEEADKLYEQELHLQKGNNEQMSHTKTISARKKKAHFRQIAKDTNIPYKKIALALGLTGLGGGLLYMNTRKGNKKTKKNKKRKFGTKSMTLDRYKDQVKNTIKKYVYKNKKVKDYSLKVRGCFKAQHLKGKNLANFLRYYKEMVKSRQIYNQQMGSVIDDYVDKRLKLFNDKYKKMQENYNKLQYTTSDNRLDIISITQHPALTTEEKSFIRKKMETYENYNENMFGNFITIIKELYPVPTLFANLTFEQIEETLYGLGFFIYLRDQIAPEDYADVIGQIEYFKKNNPEILDNKKRLDEIMNDVYKKDINEQYVTNFLDKEMEENGLFMDKDGILKMKEDSPIMEEIRDDFIRELRKEESNKFDKLGRLKDFSYIDISGIKLKEVNLKGVNLKGAILKGASLHFCNLKGANLEGANLEGADLYETNLEKANLKGANLQGVIAESAHLDNANLSGANLKGAYLQESDLEGTNLQGADLRGTDLRNCSINFKIRYFKGAKINKQTSFPNKYIGEAIMSSMDFYDKNNKKVSKNDEPAKHPGPRPKRKKGQTAKDYMDEMTLWNEANAKYLRYPGPKNSKDLMDWRRRSRRERQTRERLGLSRPLGESRPRGRIIGASRSRGRMFNTPIFPWASRSSNNNNQYDTALQPDLPEDWEDIADSIPENPGFGRSTNNNQDDFDESLYQDDLSHVTRDDGDGI